MKFEGLKSENEDLLEQISSLKHVNKKLYEIVKQKKEPQSGPTDVKEELAEKVSELQDEL